MKFVHHVPWALRDDQDATTSKVTRIEREATPPTFRRVSRFKRVLSQTPKESQRRPAYCLQSLRHSKSISHCRIAWFCSRIERNTTAETALAAGHDASSHTSAPSQAIMRGHVTVTHSFTGLGAHAIVHTTIYSVGSPLDSVSPLLPGLLLRHHPLLLLHLPLSMSPLSYSTSDMSSSASSIVSAVSRAYTIHPYLFTDHTAGITYVYASRGR